MKKKKERFEQKEKRDKKEEWVVSDFVFGGIFAWQGFMINDSCWVGKRIGGGYTRNEEKKAKSLTDDHEDEDRRWSI